MNYGAFRRLSLGRREKLGPTSDRLSGAARAKKFMDGTFNPFHSNWQAFHSNWQAGKIQKQNGGEFGVVTLLE